MGVVQPFQDFGEGGARQRGQFAAVPVFTEQAVHFVEPVPQAFGEGQVFVFANLDVFVPVAQALQDEFEVDHPVLVELQAGFDAEPVAAAAYLDAELLITQFVTQT